MLEHLPAPWSHKAHLLVPTLFHRGAGPGVVSLPWRFLDHRLTKLLNLINYKKNISSEFVGDIYIYISSLLYIIIIIISIMIIIITMIITITIIIIIIIICI